MNRIKKGFTVGLNATVLARPVTGVAKRLISLVEVMRQLRPDIKFLLFSNHKIDSSILPDLRRVVFPLPLGSLWVNHVLPRQLRREGVNIFDSQWGGGLPQPLALKSCAYITTYHDLIPLEVAGGASRYKRAVFRWRVRRNFVVADKVVTVSGYTKKRFLELFPGSADKLVVNYNGVSSHYMLFSPVEREAARGRIGVNGPFLLYVGGFNQRKNVLSLIRVFARLAKRHDGLSLVLVGKKNCYYQRSIAPLVKKLSLERHVLVVGYVPELELPDYYNSALFSVYPSLLEGFGMPVLEAMRCGCPVLAHDGSSLPEIAQGAALLVDCLDEERFYAAAENLVESGELRTVLRDKGLAVAAGFNWEDIGREYLSLYDEVLSLI